ncbi:MAG: pseudouridylate synthase [Cyclobacteriaceae bacterium]|nr:pseudouridylate synthase [Cyclobacteriaceae bacterium]
MLLEIIYQDEYLAAINKPHGLLVHRTKLANDADEFALQILRNQLEKYVFPVHRLDRKTGGVLLFGLNEDINKAMQRAFADKMVSKKYLAIVRGFTEDYGTIDYPLKRENGRIQEAITQYNTLDRAELDIPFGKHQTSRYSLLEINPLTGRYHQIRKHLDHIHHPIIGDRPHGCNKQNKLFKEKFQLMTMMLHARELSFTHPVTNEEIRIVAEIQDEFKRMIRLMKFLF